MSGPKSGNWTVVPAGQGISHSETMAILKHYLDCIIQYKKQLEALQRRQPELKIDYDADRIPSTDSFWASKATKELNNRYEIYIRLRDEIDRVNAEIAAKQRKIELENKRQKAIDDLCKKATTSYQANSNSIRNKEADVDSQLKTLLEKINKALITIDPSASVEAKNSIEAYAEELMTHNVPSQMELGLTDLRVRIGQVNQAVEKAQRQIRKKQYEESTQAWEWLSRLAYTQLDEKLKEDIFKVTTNEISISDALRQRVTDAINESDRSYAGKILKNALESIGYEAKEGFSTLFSEGGSNFFQRPNWGNYYCRVTVEPERSKINFNIVRFSEGHEDKGSIIEDKEMEEKWCSELPRLMNTLSEQGVSIDLTREIPAGQLKMQIVKDTNIKKQKSSQATAEQHTSIQHKLY